MNATVGISPGPVNTIVPSFITGVVAFPARAGFRAEPAMPPYPRKLTAAFTDALGVCLAVLVSLD
jgi:hypothetical protein